MNEKIIPKLLDLEIWVVGGAVALSVFFTQLLLWVVVLACGFWLLRRFSTGVWLKKTPVDFPVLVIVLILPLTMWASAWPAITQPQVLRLLSGIFLFYAIVNWASTPKRLYVVQVIVVLTSLALAGGALLGVEWVGYKLPFVPDFIYTRLSTVLSDTANPNVMAGSLVILFPFAPAMLLFSGKSFSNLQKVGLVLLSGFVFLILVLTQARSALLGLGAVLVLFVVFRWRRGWFIPLGGLLGSAVIFYLQEGIVRQYWIATARGLLRLEDRVEIWSRAMDMIQDFPLTGVGMGTFQNVAALFYPFRIHESGVPHAHNLLLQIGVDLGVLGLIAWMAILLTVSATSLRLFLTGRKSSDTLLAAIAIGSICSMVALIVNGLTDAVTWGMVRPAPVVWALWGFAVAAWNVYFGKTAYADLTGSGLVEH